MRLFRVSSEGMASDNEEDELDNSSYEDSFIDDGTNPMSASTQAGGSRTDMMAIYRFLKKSWSYLFPCLTKNLPQTALYMNTDPCTILYDRR